ncbi:general secretion pathway protein GspB [Variovorax terrae]|uniref:General secretion pathway protein GspB n=1 Tax=Variovorax terrae TaxID=2923278 RepID=A0A9X1VTC4_9BURK|nr:general secretion pathway protein GspB [Variovorax terrae]MCJ0763496.1 general secretion pathway protein GspB [Variovorax terrae]
MSYILDALKRADAERERGTVPGLHAQPAALPAHDPAQGRRQPLLWVGLAVALLMLGLLAWRLVLAPAPTPSPAAPTAPRVAAAPAAPLQIPAAPRPAPAPMPEPVVAAPAAPTPSPNAVPAPAPAVPAVASPSAKPAASPAPAREPAQAADTAAAKAKPAAAPAPRIYAPDELPPDIRGQLPALAISGSVYSENPQSRMLIINGQVLHEGERPAADLVLEQIGPKAAVLSFRGYRYSLGY